MKKSKKTTDRAATAGRNWHAVNAHFRKAGAMKDRKKAADKKACRGKVRED
jgi:hypothetical protein